LLCLRNARAFPLLPAALASVPFGFVLVRVRVRMGLPLYVGLTLFFLSHRSPFSANYLLLDYLHTFSDTRQERESKSELST